MNAQQKRIIDFLAAMERIDVPDPVNVVAVGAIRVKSIDKTMLVALGRDGRLQLAEITEETEPFLMAVALSCLFGQSVIVACDWAPIYAEQVTDLKPDALQNYLARMAIVGRFNEIPECNFKEFLERLSGLEDEILAAQTPPSLESVVFVPLHRRN